MVLGCLPLHIFWHTALLCVKPQTPAVKGEDGAEVSRGSYQMVTGVYNLERSLGERPLPLRSSRSSGEQLTEFLV